MSYIGNQPVYQAFVTDSFSGNGSTTAFTMSVAPANTASVLVAVSGVLQDPSTYSVSGTTLTFSAAPPSGTGNISARYLGIPASGVTTTAYRTVTEFTATAGQTTFTPPSYTVGYINVYRNGTLLGSADYTATNGTTVVLASGATAGDLVTVESFYVSSVVGAIPATAGAVTNAYLGAISTFTTPTAKTVTLPDVTGTVMVSGNMPAFRAYSVTDQSISNDTYTKIQLSTTDFDTASAFNTSLYRYVAPVAGYYFVTGNCYLSNSVAGSSGQIAIYKNGSLYQLQNLSNTSRGITGVTALISMNGTTDYIELYGRQSGATSPTIYGDGSAAYTTFAGSLVRRS